MSVVPPRLTIEFPDSLPVSGKRHEIMAALAQHQVIIVCGETGSGKTTQLPKIALAMGRGRLNARPGERGKLIGHTQPRRIAATSVAKRIAEELRTPLGEVVGYKVRFGDRLTPGASVKLMTDGILLAETQTDPLLNAYDTLIIDEAHERSLNIDFLLGYIKQILPRRPDLKLIVTSATIDADRFARHFAMPRPAPGRPKPGAAPSGGSDPHEVGERGGLVPAPVLQVSGRTYPVEQRWRPFEESREHDLNDAIAEAVRRIRNAASVGVVLGTRATNEANWALLTLVWLASLVRRDTSIMDIAYPLAPLAAAAVVAARAGPIGAHGWITLAACAAWALRLALHVAIRNLPHGEDARYAKWRAHSGARWWWWSYFQVFLLQGVLVWGWALPLVFALARPAAPLAWNDALGLLVLAAGVTFEAGADWQLARHRADPARRGTVLQSGLWALSRHPNYFGEALVWWGFFFFALSHPWGWIGIVSPLYVTWFMNQGSATRMTDAYLHKHRPDYAAYAARVPAFWPRLWR